jgi:hypothetical protein
MRQQDQQKALKKREAYATFEKAILDLYEFNSLTLDLLNVIARQYQQVEIDSAGSQQRLTHDKKDLLQVCIELEDPSFPIPPRGSNEDHEEYWELELKKWEEIVHHHWGWNAYNGSKTDQQSRKAA